MAPMKPLLGPALVLTALLVALAGAVDAQLTHAVPCRAAEPVSLTSGDGSIERARLSRVDDDMWVELWSASTLLSGVRLGPWHEGASVDVVDINGDEAPDLIERWTEHGIARAQLFVAAGDGFVAEESAGLSSPTLCLAQR